MHVDWAGYFATRKWRVAQEVTGEGEDNDCLVTFKRGKFEIHGDGVFHSPLSSARGRRGILLQETDEDGGDIKGSRIAVGEIVMRRARQEGAVR